MRTIPVLCFALGLATMVTPATAALAAGQVPPAQRATPRAPSSNAAPVAAPSSPAAQGQAGPTTILVNDADARETREQVAELLRKFPPSLGRVLKLDPSLLQSAEYLAPYPALAAFLAQHPEVARNPSFFLSDVRIGADDAPADPRSRSLEVFRSLMDTITAFSVFLVVTAALMWLLRTIIDYRRWSRLSKVQSEVHNKLLDKFAASESLVAYMETDAGRRFLESAPIPLDAEPRNVGAPLNRILWSLQTGIVVGAGGLGLQLVSRRVPEDPALAMSILGALALALGLGFIVSAAASYILSRRLGLVTTAAPASISEPGTSA